MQRFDRLPMRMFFAGLSALLLIATLSLRSLIKVQSAPPRNTVRTARLADAGRDQVNPHRFEASGTLQSGLALPSAFFDAQPGNNLGIAVAIGSALVCLCLALAITRLLRAQRNQQEMRSLLAATLSSIGDAVISTDTRGAITFMNPVAEKLTGWTSAEAAGRPLSSVFRIVNQQTHETVQNPVDKVLKSGTVVGLANHTMLVARDGSECPIDDSGSPIRDEDGKVRGVILVFRDVAERYRAQQELEASEQRFRMLFANNPIPMWIFDEETLAFLDVNEAAILHYGYTRDEFLSLTLRDIRPPEDVDDLLADIGQHCTTRHTDGPWRHRKKDGTVIAVEITAVPIELSGRPAKFVAATDVTARIQAEAALRRSEEQYRVVVETANDAVVTIDENSTIVFASRPVQTIFGYDPEALVGRPLTDLIPEPLRTAHLAGLQRYLETNQRHISWKLVEFPGLRKDGSEIPLELSIGEMRSGPRRWFTGVIRDVSERRRAQDMLQESKQFAKTVVETVPLAISGIDLLGRVLFWNRAAEQMFQWSEAELRGHELPIIPELERGEFKLLLSELAAGKQLTGIERIRRRKDGELMMCSIWTAPLRSAGGNVIGTIAVLADSTERRRAEEQTRKHMQYLAGYQRELEEFAWAASHRLQDPASTTLAKADIVERQYSHQLPPEAQRILAETKVAAAHVHSLVSGLAQYWDVQHKVLSIEPLALESVVDAAKERLASELSISQAKVTCSELPTVPGDRALLLQLFVHILDNAIKFRSRRDLHIHVSAEGMHDGSLVRIQDNGVGMSTYDIDRAFQLFHRISRQTPGIGLGLSLAKQIMKRHEGDIWISSQPEGGTTVYLMFRERRA